MRKLLTGLKNIFLQNNIDFKDKNHCKKNMILFSIPLLLNSYLELATTFIVFIFICEYTDNPDISISAISSSFNVIFPIINLFIGISIGINYEVAKAKGDNNNSKIQKIFYNSSLLILILGIIIAISGFFLANILLKVIDTPSSYIDIATKFTQIYFLGFPLLLGINFYESLIIGEGNSKGPFIVSIIFLLLNIFFVYIFVVVAKFDLLGTAYSKLLCNFIQFILYLIIIFTNEKNRVIFKLKDFKFYGKELKQMFIVGLAIGLSCFLVTFSKTITQKEIHGFGEIIIFGTAIANFYLGFIFSFIDTIGVAFATAYGQNISNNDKNFKKKIIKNSVIIMLVSYLIIGFLIYFFKKPLLSVFINENFLTPEECKTAIKYGNIIFNVNIFACALYGSVVLLTHYIRIKKRNYMVLLFTFITFTLFKIIYFIIINRTVSNPIIAFYTIMAYDPIGWLLYSIIAACFIISINRRTYANR